MMNLRKRLKLGFDRSFSGSVWRQMIWLVAVMLLAGGILWLFKPVQVKFTPLELLAYFIDPGHFGEEDSRDFYYYSYTFVVTIVGAVFFSSMLISVISNMLERRVEKFRNGDVYYAFHKHVLILGYDEMVPVLVHQIVEDREKKYDKCDIVLQTNGDVDPVRQMLHTQLNEKEERRVTILHGKRDSREELLKMRIHKARIIFLLGDCSESEHDACSLTSLRLIAEICRDKKRKDKLVCVTLLMKQSTFALFQSADIDPLVKEKIDFMPFNNAQIWARKVWVINRNSKGIEYLPLDYKPITAETEQNVHLVIMGMTTMGVAMAIEAAHLAHYPNFAKGYRTRITLIDIAARREMNFLQGRYRELFQYCRYTYREFSDEEEVLAKRLEVIPERDFIDIEWEFIQANVANPLVQNEIENWCKDKGQLVTVAACLPDPQENIAIGFYLPRCVYEHEIPVLIYQKDSDSVWSMLQRSRYKNVVPFGMIKEGYDVTVDPVEWAKRINYIYCIYDKEGLPLVFPQEKIEAYWQGCSVTDRWSNIFNALSIPAKLRSVGLDYKKLPLASELSEEQLLQLVEVEHNRWNVEKLLMGYRPTTAEENRAIENDFKENSPAILAGNRKSLKKKLNQENHIHYDICRYEDLKPDQTGMNINRYDIALTRELIHIIQG